MGVTNLSDTKYEINDWVYLKDSTPVQIIDLSVYKYHNSRRNSDYIVKGPNGLIYELRETDILGIKNSKK